MHAPDRRPRALGELERRFVGRGFGDVVGGGGGDAGGEEGGGVDDASAVGWLGLVRMFEGIEERKTYLKRCALRMRKSCWS